MMWSAWSRSVCGMVSPNVLAVLRLITNSNVVGCSTGRSAGLALQDLVDEHGDALLGVPRVLLVGHQATLLGEGAGGRHRRYSALGREAQDRRAVRFEERRAH